MASGAQAPAAPIRAESAPLTRNRAIAVWTLVVVASILMLLSSLTIWVKRQALDTNAWTNASGQMLANDEIRGQLSLYLVDTLFNERGCHRKDPAGASAETRRARAGHRRRAAERRGAGRRPDPRDTAGSGPVGRSESSRAHAPHPGPGGQGHGGRSDHPERRGRPRPEPTRPAAERPFRNPGRPGRRQDHDPPLRSTEERAARAQGDQGGLSVFLLVLVLFLYGLAIYLAHGHRRRLLRATAASFLLVGVLVLVIQNVNARRQSSAR